MRKVVVKLIGFGLATILQESVDVDCGSAPYMSFSTFYFTRSDVTRPNLVLFQRAGRTLLRRALLSPLTSISFWWSGSPRLASATDRRPHTTSSPSTTRQPFFVIPKPMAT